MSAAGKPVWYLPLAVLAIIAFLFTILGLGYDRYIFANSIHNLYPENLTTFLSADTITALKEDARLHYALLGLTESIAHSSSDIGQRYGFGGMEQFGALLTDSITELRKRHGSRSQKRALVDDMSQAMGDLLGGLGVNTTDGFSSIAGTLGAALTEGLATPALFLGIGLG